LPGSDHPEIIALGEPMAEFAAETPGGLGAARVFRRGYGGDTANFVVAAARMGGRCGYVTRIGDDEFGRAFLALWDREGVDRSRVIIEPEGSTAVYFIARRGDGGHDFTYYRAQSPASRLRPEDLDHSYLAGARVLHTSGITQAISASALAAVEAALDIAARAGVAVSYDVNVRPRLWSVEAARAAAERTFSCAHLVFVSHEDAAHLYPGADAEDAARRILDQGPRAVVLKRGAAGCTVLAAGAAPVRLSGWAVEAVDTTGAGDAFAGAFVAAWVAGSGFEDAAVLANAAGALTATGLGATAPIPDRATVTTFIQTRQITVHTRRE
jgi:2-dehydro-3-deoxygluconokinase